MEQRISLVTLGVGDVSRARTFYEALGWWGQTVEGTVFFQTGGLAVVLWDRELLAADAGADAGGDADVDAATFGGIALAQNVRSRAEVDAILAAAEAAGAIITRPAAETFYGGYAGYFADPDGHRWEIAHNPGFTLTDDGSLVLPDFGTAPA
jgi:catechol 2,3-dioxygenase-like lactoylglutathione lyase family enzyme